MEARDGSDFDNLLQSFLRERDDGESELLLAKIISDHAGPLIRNIVRYKIIVGGRNQSSAQDAEDVCSTAILGLLARLKTYRRNNSEPSIMNFRSYVGVVILGHFERQFV